MIYLAGLIVAYLLGSIPFGFLVAKFAGKGDLRNVGSGGTGATNVMRVGGLKLAALVWLLDMLKSVFAVAIGAAIAGEVFGALCGFVSIVGHCYPVWLKFKGGKGISSMLGALVAISPVAFVICAMEWLIVALTTGYSSLGSVVAFGVLPFLGFAIGFKMGLVFTAIALICLWRHRENIKRLITGTESKIEWKWKK